MDRLQETLEAILIMQMRLYDVHMLALTADVKTEEAAKELFNEHAAGRVKGPLPSWTE